MDSSEPTPLKIRKLNDVTDDRPTFDRLPPDVICSEILVHFVANILYLPRFEYQSLRYYSVDSDEDCEVRVCELCRLGDHSRCCCDLPRLADQTVEEREAPEDVIWWLSPLVEDEFLNRSIFPISVSSLPVDHQTLQGKTLFGRFSRDPLRHPWFIFRSIRINHDDGGVYSYTRASLPHDIPQLGRIKSSDWIPRFVFLNLKQVVFLKLPEIGDWKSIQPRSVPNLKRWNCWGEKLTEDVLNIQDIVMSPRLVLCCPSAHVCNTTLPRYTGTELMCLEIELDDWVDDDFEVLNSTSIVDNLKKLTLIGEYFYLKTLPPLNSLEFLELQHVYCSDQAFSSMDCSLRTLILRDCHDLKYVMPRCLRTLVRFWFQGEDPDYYDKESFVVVFDRLLQNETFSSLRDLKVTKVGEEFKFLWLCRSRRLRSLVIHYRRERSEDGNNLLIKGLDLRDVQYLHLSSVDIELVENGAPRDENRFVLLENDSKIL